MGETARQNPKANAEPDADGRPSAPGSASSLEREVDAMLDSVDETLERVARAMGDPFEDADEDDSSEVSADVEVDPDPDGAGPATVATGETSPAEAVIVAPEAPVQDELNEADVDGPETAPPAPEGRTPDESDSDESPESLEAIDSMLADAAAHMLTEESEPESSVDAEDAEASDPTESAEPSPSVATPVEPPASDGVDLAPAESPVSEESEEDDDPEKIDPELKAELESHLNEVAADDDAGSELSERQVAALSSQAEGASELRSTSTPKVAPTASDTTINAVKASKPDPEVAEPHSDTPAGSAAVSHVAPEDEDESESEASPPAGPTAESIVAGDDEPTIRDDLRGVAQVLRRWASHLPARERMTSAAVATLERINRPWSRFSDDTKLMILMFAGGTAIVAGVAWTLVLLRIL